MVLFVECLGKNSGAVMKDSPSEISVVLGLFKETHWVCGSRSSVLLLCSLGCTRTGPGLTGFDGDGTRLIKWSVVEASIATEEKV